jgi:hypothetical protein
MHGHYPILMVKQVLIVNKKTCSTKAGYALVIIIGKEDAGHAGLFAVRVVFPFFDDLFRWPAAPVMIGTGRCLAGRIPVSLFGICIRLVPLRSCRNRGFLGLLLLAPGAVPPAPMVPGTFTAIGAAFFLTLPGLWGLLPFCGLRGFCGWLTPRFRRLLLLFCHNVQTDHSGRRTEISWHGYRP